jgi:hypothetical protein
VIALMWTLRAFVLLVIVTSAALLVWSATWATGADVTCCVTLTSILSLYAGQVFSELHLP